VELTVSLVGDKRSARLFVGHSDGDGLVDAHFTVPSWPTGDYKLRIEAESRGRHDVVERAVELSEGSRLMLQSDKPLYQPTQTIHLRAVALRPQDGRPVGEQTVTFTLADPRGNTLFRETAKTSRFGVASVEFVLADEISLGNYTARATAAGADDAQLTVPVDRYRLPKIKVAVESDRTWYAPGQHAAITVDAHYFFGKPVAGQVTLVPRTKSSHVSVVMQKMVSKLDGNGKARFDVQLPSSGDGTALFEVEVADTAAERQTAAREVPFVADGLRVEVTPEARAAAPGSDLSVFVTVAGPDGAVVPDAEVELEGVKQRTDAVGVTTFVLPRLPEAAGCGRGKSQISVEARAGARGSGRGETCVVVDRDALVVRADHALYAAGAPMTVEIAGGSDGLAYLDIWKDGQIIDTARVGLDKGHGKIVLPADERRFGTLALAAYRVSGDSRRRGGSTLVYVERPSSLRLEARLDGQTARKGEPPSYAPGAEGRIHLRVLDAQTGRGTEAQVLAVMVDEALLALRAAKPGATRLFFHLADAARLAGNGRRAAPAGSVGEILDGGDLTGLRDEAARVLLAGAAPAWDAGWHNDPWAERVQRRDEQLNRLVEKVVTWVESHPAGERVPNTKAGWRWRRDLLAAMASSGAIPQRDLHDPWGRRIASNTVVESAGLGNFSDWARNHLDERMRALYVALAKAGVERDLPPDTAWNRAGRKRAVLFTDADLQRWADAGKIPKALLLDSWGQPFRVYNYKKPLRVGSLYARGIIASVGPDGELGTGDDLFALNQSWGTRPDEISVMAGTLGQLDAYGHGGLGLVGFGRGGGGGTGSGFGMGMGRIGTIGHGAGVAEARVRRDFPETMLWRPDIMTDAHGEAVVDFAVADSITTWQLGLEAIAADGRIGQLTSTVRVFQDFFVDVDLPSTATQHDELSLPVTVYNYLPRAQRVRLRVEEAPWMTLLDGKEQSIDLGANEVGVRYVRIAVGKIGYGKLLVRADGEQLSDAVERAVDVRPDGVPQSVSFQDRISSGSARHHLEVPPDAIADASLGAIKVYPSMATHVIEGLDSMLRMPGGCFEQTSSTTYPNALILNYLRKTGKATPDVEKKAKQYLAAGWQRLVTFEVPGGGFSWFGRAPANKILTAYGIQEFQDMSSVYPIDQRVIERTQKWLVHEQRADGSWEPDKQFINEGATNRFNSDVTRITAYIALALERTGWKGPELGKAIDYVKKHVGEVKDPYTLALVGELLGERGGNELGAVLDKLWSSRNESSRPSLSPDGERKGDQKRVVSFQPLDKTPTYGAGNSGIVETTARAVQALAAGPGGRSRADAAVGYLLGAKDSFGNWYSTQATILSLKALLSYGGRRQTGKGLIHVLVDGREVANLPVDLADDRLQSVDAPGLAQPGAHDVELRWEGPGTVAYQVVGRWWATHATPREGDVMVQSRLNQTQLIVGDEVTETVTASLKSGAAAVDMPIVTAGLPPGFDVDGAELDRLVADKVVDKVQRDRDGVILYLTRLTVERPFSVSLHLKPRFPLRVQIPPPSAYEYYRPERRASGGALTVTVTAKNKKG
jgi:hypothetical protein